MILCFCQVIPLLLESLNAADTEVKMASLNGVFTVLTATPQSFSLHISTLLPCLLSLISDKDSMVGVLSHNIC